MSLYRLLLSPLKRYPHNDKPYSSHCDICSQFLSYFINFVNGNNGGKNIAILL